MTMMACGHAANSVNTKTGQPSCIICIGIYPGAETIVVAPDLTNRTSKCSDCGKMAPSRLNLPFFEYRRRLQAVVARLRAGQQAGQEELDSLMEISTVGIPGKLLALGTAMKDDLGSYMKVAIQA